MAGFWWRTGRVAILLPQLSALYSGANRMPGIRLAFFDLRDGAKQWLTRLESLAPTTMVAPSRVLRHLAEYARLTPLHLCRGETLDPAERQVIKAWFGMPLGRIHMATEGLFAVACRHGRLHLAEDANYIEFEPVGDGLVSRLITSFQLWFQSVARYRMIGLLRLRVALAGGGRSDGADGRCVCVFCGRQPACGDYP